MSNSFDSEYCSVGYVEDKDTVLLTWKKFACFENYRKPASFALEMLEKYRAENFVIDARNGFEDEKEDVEWGFSYLLPEMAKTNCKKVAFIMNAANGIEGEMDMWAKECGKYFAVCRGDSFENVIDKMKRMIWVDVVYQTKEDMRDEFYSELLANDITAASRREPGNYRYDFSVPMENDDELWLTEIWTDANAITLHNQTEHYQILAQLKKEYVKNVKIKKYEISSI